MNPAGGWLEDGTNGVPGTFQIRIIRKRVVRRTIQTERKCLKDICVKGKPHGSADPAGIIVFSVGGVTAFH
jgi:hypothetical protein